MVSLFDKVVKLDPKLSLGFITRAYTYAEIAKYKEALRDYDKVLNELAPDDAATYIRRGFVYVETAQYEKAVSDFSKTIVLSELYKPYALNNRADAKRLQKKYEEALKDVDE